MSVEAQIVIGAIMAPLFIVWMTWVAKTLWDIKQSVTGVQATQKDHERRIAELEALAPRQVVVIKPQHQS